MSRTSGDRDDFYVGYQKRMPPGLARFTRRGVGVMLLAAALLAVAVPLLHKGYAYARSDFRDIRDFEGVFLAQPAPHIVIVRPGETGSRAFSRYVLVGRGKSGPRIDVEGLHGKQVRIKGSLIYRDAQTLLLPATDEQVDAALRRLKCFTLLQGYRGKAAADLDAVLATIRALVDFAAANSARLLEMDVNPLMITPDGCIAADVLICETIPLAQN